MDLGRDYRGDSITTREFNYDAYQVSCLFHGQPVSVELFRPFVVWSPKTRKEAYTKLKYLKTCKDLGKHRVRAPGATRPQDSDNLVKMFHCMQSHIMTTKAMSVLKVVAVAQDYAVLDAVLCRYKELYGDNRMEALVLRYFLIGTDMGDGHQRVLLENNVASTQLQLLRRLAA